ncbi:MAG: hypothetical protein KKE64_02815, partial [Candidatus Omnitrophica bacterium]|nr:hypothetical protein [Candidatus Omnitrophota bacterium]
SLIFGFIAILYIKPNIMFVSLMAILGFIILIFFGLFLFEGTNYGSKFKSEQRKKSGEKTLLNTVFMHKRRMVEVFLDFVLICMAYYAAYFLRFEGSVLFRSGLPLLQQSLPWIICIKMSVFFAFGLYRGVWRYISLSDFFTMFKVVSLGSILSILFVTLTYRFQDYSRAVFFIDWLLLLFLIMGSRFMFRILGEFFVRLQSNAKGKRVLIFGAGDIGEMAVREIKRNKDLNYVAVGFIDDDPRKIGSKINGVPVLGSRNKIGAIIRENSIEEIIIAISGINSDDLNDIIGVCKEFNISYKKIKGILDD